MPNSYKLKDDLFHGKTPKHLILLRQNTLSKNVDRSKNVDTFKFNNFNALRLSKGDLDPIRKIILVRENGLCCIRENSRKLISAKINSNEVVPTVQFTCKEVRIV